MAVQIHNTFTTQTDTTLEQPLGIGSDDLYLEDDAIGAEGPEWWAVLSDGSQFEVVKVTAGTASPFTVSRAQEGTSGIAWSAGATVNAVLTEAALRALIAEIAAAVAETAVSAHNTDSAAHTDLFAGKANTSHTHAQSDVTGLTDALTAKQDADADLAAIAVLTPANDDVLQRKSDNWVNRTLAQLRADLQALSSWTFSNAVGFPNGSASAVGAWFRAVGNGIYSSAANTLNFAAGGTLAITITTTLVTIASTRSLIASGGFRAMMWFDLQRYNATNQATGVGISAPVLLQDLTASTSDNKVYCDTSEITRFNFGFSINGEPFVAGSKSSDGNGTYLLCFRPGTPQSHTAGDILDSPASEGVMAIPYDRPMTMMDVNLTGDIEIYVPPRFATAGGEVQPPAQNQRQELWFRNMNGHTATLKDTYDGATIGDATSSLRMQCEVVYDSGSQTNYFSKSA